jgi:hypothetical protein
LLAANSASNFPSQFLIDVGDDNVPTRNLASYDRAAFVAVTKINLKKSGH